MTAVGRRVKRLTNTYAFCCEIHYRRLAEHENHVKRVIVFLENERREQLRFRSLRYVQ